MQAVKRTEVETVTVPDEQLDAPFVETVKVALYGAFGSFKTGQIGNLVKSVGADKICVVSAEHGLNTVRSLVKSKNIIPVKSLDDLRTAWARCNSEFNTTEHWVCIDGGSRIMEWIANVQFSGADKYYELKCRGFEIPDNMKVFGRYISDKSDTIDAQKLYGRIGRDSEQFLDSWIQLKSNLYVNYLEDMTGSNGREKTIPWGPDVPGRVGLKAVMSSFDYVGRLGYNSDGQVTGHFDPASKLYMARTREDRNIGVKIPKEIPNFDLAKFVRLISVAEGH